MSYDIEKHDDGEMFDQELFVKNLDLLDSLISKSYLADLSSCDLEILDQELDPSEVMAFLRIEKIVYRKNENVNDKLVSVFSALSSHGSSVLLLIKGHSDGVDFYLGTKNVHYLYEAEKILSTALCGNFPGVLFDRCQDAQVNCLMSETFPENYSCKAVAAVDVVPGDRDSDKDNFVQGVEKFIEGMEGKTYTAFVVATPITIKKMEAMRGLYEKVYTDLSPLLEIQQQLTENESLGIAQGVTENCARSVNAGMSRSLGVNTSESRGDTRSRDSHSGFGFLLMNHSAGASRSKSTTSTEGYSDTETETSSETSTTSVGITETATSTTGVSSGLTLTRKNKTIENILDNVEEQLERIKQCQSYGLWEVGCYFVADYKADVIVAANTFKATVAGDSSHVENAHVNVWSNQRSDYASISRIFDYLRVGENPVFDFGAAGNMSSGRLVSPTALVSGKELPFIAGLPQSSTSGLTVLHSAEFGRNVLRSSTRKQTRIVDLGAVSYMDAVNPNNRVLLDVDSLTAHCFITGSTGSGKSNTTYRLLDELVDEKNGVKFLVVEPAKGEYKRQYGKLKGINVYTTNPKYNEMLRINPFYFPDEIHVLEHLDRMIEVFSACWPLYAAMPALLKQSFERAYVRHGWDLSHSLYIDVGNGKYPTFRDVAEILPELLDATAFAGEQKGNYVGSLVTRIESLTNGLIGQIFTDKPIESARLFDENTIVDLSRVGSLETKAMIMGTLVLLLSEYRQSEAGGPNRSLKHVTILEEAHNLLKRTSTDQGQESSNLQGKSVEMIANSIAEMRTYGEGFIIVDQSPSSVDISAIKNTNTKIVMNLPEQSDRESAGKAVGLEDDQILEIAKLSTGTAIVFQNDWVEPVLVKIEKCGNDHVRYDEKINHRSLQVESRGSIAQEVFRQYDAGVFERSAINMLLASSPLKGNIKSELKATIFSALSEKEPAVRARKLHLAIYEITDCGDLFDLASDKAPRLDGGSALTQQELRTYFDWRSFMERNLDQYVLVDDAVIRRRIIDSVLTAIAVEKKLPSWRIYRALKMGLVKTIDRKKVSRKGTTNE